MLLFTVVLKIIKWAKIKWYIWMVAWYFQRLILNDFWNLFLHFTCSLEITLKRKISLILAYEENDCLRFSSFQILVIYAVCLFPLHQNYLQLIFEVNGFLLFDEESLDLFCWKGTGWVVDYCWEVATFTLFSTFLLEKCSPQL